MPNTIYALLAGGATRIVYFNSAKAYINGVLNPTIPVTTPPNTAFVRISFAVGVLATQQFELGSVNTAYEAYYQVIPKEILEDKFIDNYNSNNLIAPIKTSFMTTNNSNLIDPLTVMMNYYIVSTTGEVLPIGGAKTSPHIPVKEGHIYTQDGTWSIAFYKNGVFVSGYDSPQTTPIVTIPMGLGINSVRITGDSNQVLHFVEGSSITSEELQIKTIKYTEDLLRQIVSIPYFNQIVNTSLRIDPINKPRWEGKIVNFLGDSITAGLGLVPTTDNYTKTVKELLGIRIANNYGASSSYITNLGGVDSFAERFGAMSNIADLNVVFGGINDFRGSVPIGLITDTVDTTFMAH